MNNFPLRLKITTQTQQTTQSGIRTAAVKATRRPVAAGVKAAEIETDKGEKDKARMR